MTSRKFAPDPPPYCVKPSSIHGHGVFATRFIKRGEWVHMPVPFNYHLLVGFKDFGGFNHSCQHNLGQHADPTNDFRPALRDIHPGEELTVSYLGYLTVDSVMLPHQDQPYELSFLCRCPICRP